MALHTRKNESDEAPGAPEWMVTFSDCMTLLLTFFVLLMSFSSFDDKTFRKLKVIFANALGSASKASRESKDSVVPMLQIIHTREHDDGSEKPTLVSGKKDQLMKETEPADFRRQKVFIIPSEEVFWARGTVISRKGRDTLTNVASYLSQVPGPVVISENEPQGRDRNGQYGLARAWAVTEYLTTTGGLNMRRFCLSAATTIADKNTDRNTQADSSATSPGTVERHVEIVLLERSVYD